MSSCIAKDYLTASSQTWVPTSTTISFGSSKNNRINVRYVLVAHPRANGQVKCANGMVLDTLKKRLHDAANTKGGKWIKELSNALWGLRTRPTKPTGQSPYFLVYGSKAILPADVMW
jgi:hypothetical protein